MKPEHVKKFEESISYPEYTEEDKKRGMNNKDLDFMTDNIMFYAVFYLLSLSLDLVFYHSLQCLSFLTNQSS